MFRGFGIVILAVSTAVSGASFVATANSPESGSFTSSNTPQPSQSSESETSAPTETLSQTQVVESSQADESAPSSESETSAPTETLSQTQVVESSQADESAPTWNLLAAGERTAIFPADVMQQSNLTLNNGTYFYNLSNWSSSHNRGSFGFSPNSTVTLDLADIRDGQFSSWGLCAEDNSGALRMSWNRTGASGENVTAGYRIGCSFNVAGMRAVYQSNSQPTYYPSGPQRNVGNSTLIAGGWTQCYIGNYQQTVAYSTITNACTERA